MHLQSVIAVKLRLVSSCNMVNSIDQHIAQDVYTK